MMSPGSDTGTYLPCEKLLDFLSVRVRISGDKHSFGINLLHPKFEGSLGLLQAWETHVSGKGGGIVPVIAHTLWGSH